MRYFDLTNRGIQNFYTSLPARWTVLQPVGNKQTRFYESKVEYIFVPKFYHNRASHDFLHRRYIGRIQESNTISELGRLFYFYKSEKARTHTFLDSELNWNFPDKDSTTIWLTVRGFEFTFPNLKKYKNVRYRLKPPGLLFLASLKNDTEQIFITCKELNDVKKSLINSKIYRLLGIIDLKKINNLQEIKGQSLWINATLEEQK